MCKLVFLFQVSSWRDYPIPSLVVTSPCVTPNHHHHFLFHTSWYGLVHTVHLTPKYSTHWTLDTTIIYTLYTLHCHTVYTTHFTLQYCSNCSLYTAIMYTLYTLYCHAVQIVHFTLPYSTLITLFTDMMYTKKHFTLYTVQTVCEPEWSQNKLTTASLGIRGISCHYCEQLRTS